MFSKSQKVDIGAKKSIYHCPSSENVIGDFKESQNYRIYQKMNGVKIIYGFLKSIISKLDIFNVLIRHIFSSIT